MQFMLQSMFTIKRPHFQRICTNSWIVISYVRTTSLDISTEHFMWIERFASILIVLFNGYFDEPTNVRNVAADTQFFLVDPVQFTLHEHHFILWYPLAQNPPRLFSLCFSFSNDNVSAYWAHGKCCHFHYSAFGRSWANLRRKTINLCLAHWPVGRVSKPLSRWAISSVHMWSPIDDYSR